MTQTTQTEILPGTHVRTATGLIGSVERVDPHEVDGVASGTLLVRATDSARRYRIPLQLVEARGEEVDQSVVHTMVRLALDPADLERYIVGDDEDQDTRASAGSVAERHDTVVSAATARDAGETLRIPVFAEEMMVEMRPIQRGIVRVHKSVETTEQRLTTTLTHDDVIIERIPADQYDASTPPNPDETIIPVIKERLVVETRAVVVEYVRIRTRRVTEDQEVRAPVRREVVTVQELRAHGAATTDPPLLRETADAHTALGSTAT